MDSADLYLKGVRNVLESRVKLNLELATLYRNSGDPDIANLYQAKMTCFEDAVEIVATFEAMQQAVTAKRRADLPF